MGEPSYAVPTIIFATVVPTSHSQESAANDAVVFDRRSNVKESHFVDFKSADFCILLRLFGLSLLLLGVGHFVVCRELFC